jgi:hypothetical protein
METVISTSECAWSSISMNILGRKVIGLRGFELKKTIEKEHLYASGDNPHDIQTGNKAYTGSIKALKYEVDQFNDAALEAGFEDITEIPHPLITITVQYKKTQASRIRTVTLPGVGFTDLTFAMEQNAKMTEVTLPFLAMGMKIL